MDASLKKVHAKIYQVGTNQGFNGEKVFINLLDGMTFYIVVELLNATQLNANKFTVIFMKISLTHEIYHILVIDRDSKLKGTFIQPPQYIKINTYVILGGNYDPILMERFHSYLNKS